MKKDDVGDRLALSVGILLTFTAFQSSINDELPSTSQMSWIHWYIFFAYVIQALLIFCSCLIGGMIGEYDEKPWKGLIHGFKIHY